ncbi:hypothetical protein MJO29_001259 [Puccinia striiformis f. sp. tritici]|nr:hypothetical protein MJO29_001259 [Puccinia striiformis f. sp. tritici]
MALASGSHRAPNNQLVPERTSSGEVLEVIADVNEPANVGNNPTIGTAPDRNPTAATNGASRQPIWPASRTRRQQFPLTAGLRNPSPSIPMTSRLGISPANRFLTGVRGRTPRLEDLNPTSTHTVLHPGFNFATGTFQQHPNPNQRNHPVSSTSDDRSVANSQPPPTGQAEEVEVVQLTLTLDNDGDIDDAIGSQVDEESTAGPEPEPQWIDIHINYQFHVVQAANNPPNNPRARKQKSASSSTQDDLPKTMKLKVKDNKIVVPWALNNLDLARFKRETIDAIRQNVNEWLARHAKDLEGRGAIEWQVAIKNGGAFAGAQNQVLLPSNDTFQRFLEAADCLPKGKMKTCTLVQEDPKVVAQNELAFKQLKAHHTPNDNPGEPSREPMWYVETCKNQNFLVTYIDSQILDNTAQEMESTDNFTLRRHSEHHRNPSGAEDTPFWTPIPRPEPVTNTYNSKQYISPLTMQLHSP